MRRALVALRRVVPLVTSLTVCGAVRAEDERCPKGARTTLTIEKKERPDILRPDESIGGDVLSMRAGKRELMHAVSHDFFWICLSYSKQRGHLVGTTADKDGALVLRTIGYLAEDSDVLEASAFTRERFHAYAALPRKDGRFVAFIGGRDDLALYVLDTKQDVVRKLAPAPSPEVSAVWSGAAYGELPRSFWRFEGPTLVVSYTQDAKAKRVLRRFKL